MSDTMPTGEPWPKVSIVTPSYNQGQFIEETIRSVLLQGYPNLEYIIIDGNSTDGSADIIRGYEAWLTYWVSEPDRGQSHAINKGWNLATGDILAWLNSDDTYAPGGVGRAAEFLGAHPYIGMVYGAADIIDESGEFIEPSPTRPFDLEALVCGEWFISQPAVFVRQKVIDTVGGVTEELHMVMDWELWLRIALAEFEIRYLAGEVANLRLWTGAKTQFRSERLGRERLRVLDELFSNPALPPALQALRGRAYCYVHAFIGANCCVRKQMVEACHHIFKAVGLYPRCVIDPYMAEQVLFWLVGKTAAIRLRAWMRALSRDSSR